VCNSSHNSVTVAMLLTRVRADSDRLEGAKKRLLPEPWGQRRLGRIEPLAGRLCSQTEYTVVGRVSGS
jgi:hypothetical protein